MRLERSRHAFNEQIKRRSSIFELVTLIFQADDFRQEVEPVEGKKGGIETIIVALGTAGAFKAIVETFAHWLKRDRSRHIRLTTKQGGEERVIEVDANGIDAGTIPTTCRS